MAVSGIEAPATTRLFNLWLEQAFGGVASLRVGQTTAAQEFLISQSANLFVNSSFGWPLITAVNLPSGGPAYPEAALGARLKVTPGDKLSVMVAIFDGDPAGPGPGGPVDRDPHGFAFRIDDSPFLIGEIDYAVNPFPTVVTNHQEGYEPRTRSAAGTPSASGPPGAIKLGAWYHSGQFSDRRFDAQSLSLADPRSTGQPLQHRGNYGVYGVIDQMLWRVADDSGDHGLSGFVRASFSPDDRNLVDFYADVGLTFKGMSASRPDDTCGIALAYVRISRRAAERDRDQAAFTGMPVPIEGYEATLELTYQLQIVEGWMLQPDLQYVLHPGGHVASPLDPGGTTPMENAVVVGVRTMLRF